MKKILCTVLSLILILSLVSPALAAGDRDRFTITDPYAAIDWDSVRQYKTALHSHTNASDGDHTLYESLERHYRTGFDIVAVTDHGVVDEGWDDGAKNNLIKRFLSVLGRSAGDLVYLGETGAFSDGTPYAYKTTVTGDHYLYAGDRVIMQLPYGVENNAVSVNAHVNSWFVNDTDNSVTTYADAVRRVERLGGLSVINHPGEYTKARYALSSDEAYNTGNAAYAYYVNMYADLLDRYPSCIGIDVNSKGDNRTRFDRVLWDELLTRFSANGKTVGAIASSDAHQLDKIDTGFTLLLMPTLSAAAAKRALANGEYFAASHCNGNPEELRDIASALRVYYGENAPTLRQVEETLAKMDERIAGIKSGKYGRDDAIGVEYTVLDDEGFTTVDTFPTVRRVTVDDDENTIAFETEDALLVRFISNGRLIATLPAENAVLRLDDYANELGDYVRAEIWGEGGILYTQAFLLNAGQNAGHSEVAAGIRKLGFFDFLLAELNRWFTVVARFFRSVF